MDFCDVAIRTLVGKAEDIRQRKLASRRVSDTHRGDDQISTPDTTNIRCAT
jgi:hypothetical protein